MLDSTNHPTEDASRLGRTGDRPFWIRTGSVFVRAAHLLAVAAVAGACFWSVEDGSVHVWWMVAGVSGVLLLATEVVKHVELYREVSGWSTILKLVLLGGMVVAPAVAVWLMSAAIVVAALGAHFPRTWRHRKLF